MVIETDVTTKDESAGSTPPPARVKPPRRRLIFSRRQTSAEASRAKDQKESGPAALGVFRKLVISLIVALLLASVLMNASLLLIVFAMTPTFVMHILDHSPKKLIAFSTTLFNLAGLTVSWKYMDERGMSLFSDSILEVPVFVWLFPIALSFSSLGLHYLIPQLFVRLRMSTLEANIQQIEKDIAESQKKWGKRLPAYTMSGVEIKQKADPMTELEPVESSSTEPDKAPSAESNPDLPDVRELSASEAIAQNIGTIIDENPEESLVSLKEMINRES